MQKYTSLLIYHCYLMLSKGIFEDINGLNRRTADGFVI